jgi:hypothetical protein
MRFDQAGNMRVPTLLPVALVVVALMAADLARGQNNSLVSLEVSLDDVAVASFSYRALGLVGSTVPAPFAGQSSDGEDIPAISKPGFYPDDVNNPGRNPAVVTTEHHPIYVNNMPSHWGDVSSFLTDLGKSDFIHVLDQYVDSSADNRYTLGTSFISPNYPIPANHTLTIVDVARLVHAAASIKGNGFGNFYHVFLPKGVDMCLPPPFAGAPAACYSPDNPSTFVFCAFHGAFVFRDLGEVIFSLEPYQDVNGCNVPPSGTANNQLVDSTDNVLSHEVFEGLSDPDGREWWVHAFTVVNGNEIGDLCIRFGFFKQFNNYYWLYGHVKLNGHNYTVQPEYSNQFHGCSYLPASDE